MNENRFVTAYQDAFSSWLGVGSAYAFWKGRVALYAILKAMGVGEDDEVIIPGYTCVMAVNPIVYVGAKPIFVDIEPATYNINPNLIEARITRRTKVIIAQHTYGYPAEMDAIMALAASKGLPVIEDCCLALGSEYRGKRCGTFGAAAYFSSQWNKPFTTGLGGIAVTDDRDLAQRIEEICREEVVLPRTKDVAMLRAQLLAYRTAVYPRTTVLAQSLFRFLTKTGFVVGSSSPDELWPKMPDGFFKIASSLQARAGLRQLRKIEQNLAHRRRMAGVYAQLFHSHNWPVPAIPEHLDPVLVRCPVRVADKEKALATASRHLVELGSWFECPLHPVETPLEAYGYRMGMCPESEKACREVVNLPLHPRAGKRTVRRSVEFIMKIGSADV